MPVVKGGVWSNVEDEILKAAISKYGLNQWARVSSLLARKTAKQCKARWHEWLDPGIRKVEWSRAEDEKLLHLAKLMPTQWRTIAPIVGRTATQCLERYQKLLDDAEAREGDGLGLGGPEGGETQAPSADDVRRLRPGETDPDPESKPARPDAIDMDEDEKEMLSEARARLANTQGKKAKRKARERQLDESRRLALLQKRRELKNSGINIRVTTRKKGQMDYNADIPFEKAPAPGFYDVQEESDRNEKQRAAFDPRKQQLANKRKQADAEMTEAEDRKRKKGKDAQGGGVTQAAQQAAQQQKIREAEQMSRRKALNLPAPQVNDAELEDIVKMGIAGDRAGQMANANESVATRGLVGNYTGMTVGATPIRTPRAPQEEDRIANELRDARARTETQSALLGGENTPLHEGAGTTGYDGVAPSKAAIATPNPLATPLRQPNGIAATGRGAVSATPMRTPRDTFSLNDADAPVGQTPREVKLAQQSLRSRFASLPRPKEEEYELELPDESDEIVTATENEEDRALIDARAAALREAEERAELKRQTQVVQRGLPMPRITDLSTLNSMSQGLSGIEKTINDEMALLIANDVKKYGSHPVRGTAKQLDTFTDAALELARMELAVELGSASDQKDRLATLQEGMDEIYNLARANLSIEEYTSNFNQSQSALMAMAESGNKIESKLAKLLGGYQARSRTLRANVVKKAEQLAETRRKLDTARTAQINEQAAIASRLEELRDAVGTVRRREREAQDTYRERKEELDGLPVRVNGVS